jgi:histidinol-phosphatase (PHP family)
LLIDFHVHSPYCGHAQGKTIDYVESAIAKGLPEIGFSDHLGRYYLSRSQRRHHWDWGMDEHLLARYYNELTELRDAYADRIAIRIGLEVDYIEGAEDLLTPIMQLYPLDFLLGSIHCLPKFSWKHIAKMPEIAEDEIYKEYFRCARAAVASGLFQSLAHPDFIWRYARWPHHITDDVYRWIQDTVKAAAEKGTCVEINVNGYTWSLVNDENGIDPMSRLITAIREYGACVSVGSDAHTPQSVANSFDDLETYLRVKGIDKYAVFEGKKKRIIAI